MKYIAIKNYKVISIFDSDDLQVSTASNPIVAFYKASDFNGHLKVGDVVNLETKAVSHSDSALDRIYHKRRQDFPDIQDQLLAIHQYFKATNVHIGGFTDRIDECLDKHPHPNGDVILPNPDKNNPLPDNPPTRLT